MRPWTHAEEEALRILAPRLGGKACAATLDRSLKSVERKAAQLGVSLRRKSCGGIPGETCGPAVLKRVRELSQAQLCPACAKRPVGVKTTGLCGHCHFEHLTLAHEEEIAKADAQLALWAARSKLLRRRRKLAEVHEALVAAETGGGAVTMVAEDATDPREATCTG
ncbi:MAG: hypothetical protein WC709_09310 [Thermoleophilia bacterium]